MLPQNPFRGSINVGAVILHDHRVFTWPGCCPPSIEYAGTTYEYVATNPHMIFDMRVVNSMVECKAFGYGDESFYANGCIFVLDNGVTPCE